MAKPEKAHSHRAGDLTTAAGSDVETQLAAKETPAGAQSKVDAAIAALINSSPAALDTLKELADALADDASFAATMTAALAGKAGLAGNTFTLPQTAPAFKATGPSGTSGLTGVRFVGILSDAGPPVAGDGTFVAGDVVFDTAGQAYLCTVGGTPGTFVAVGSGRVIGGPVSLTTLFTQTTTGTAEDIPGMSASFTYDGRPVEFVIDGGASLSHDVTSTFRNLQLAIQRSTDSATQVSALANSTCGSSAFSQASSSIHVMSGPLTAWPSDSAAFVVGTSYTIKLNYTVVTSGKGRVVASTSAPLKLYVVTR